VQRKLSCNIWGSHRGVVEDSGGVLSLVGWFVTGKRFWLFAQRLDRAWDILSSLFIGFLCFFHRG